MQPKPVFWKYFLKNFSPRKCYFIQIYLFLFDRPKSMWFSFLFLKSLSVNRQGSPAGDCLCRRPGPPASQTPYPHRALQGAGGVWCREDGVKQPALLCRVGLCPGLRLPRCQSRPGGFWGHSALGVLRRCLLLEIPGTARRVGSGVVLKYPTPHLKINE